jgi:hypothetical protein
MIRLSYRNKSRYQLQIDDFITEVEAYEDEGILQMDSIDLPKILLKHTVDDFPDNSSLRFDLDNDGRFNFIEIKKRNGIISFFLSLYTHCSDWRKEWAQGKYFAKLAENLALEHQIKVIRKSYDGDSWQIDVKYLGPEKTVRKIYSHGQKLLTVAVKITELELQGFKWKDIYLKNERVFSIEFIRPLLLKLGFSQIRYCHGKKEYGKDFTFIDQDKFGLKRCYALQVKAGNVRGNAKSQIDRIIGQIEDSFSMPYFDIGSKNPQYISNLIVAISGIFTENAKEKIAEKLRKGLYGSVYFFDRDSLLELAYKSSNSTFK